MAETYDRVADIVGITVRTEEDEKAGLAGNTLLPKNHWTKNTDAVITLNGDGTFSDAKADPLKNMMIPCTEDSANRAGKTIYPYPLHEELGYLALNAEKRKAYLAQLAVWSGRHPKVMAVYRYIEGGTILDDLQKHDIDAKSDKLFIRFNVNVSGDFEQSKDDLWEDPSVAKAWQEYCAASLPNGKTLCFAAGAFASRVAKHPKGVNPVTSNAKLISCNDDTNYTYRGRFSAWDQASVIGADASHKAHAMLKYLIATQGRRCDTQAVVAWAVDDGRAEPDPFDDGFSMTKGIVTAQNALDNAKGELGVNCAKELRKALLGMGDAENLEALAKKRRTAVIAVDAATTGRMGVTFYQDLSENEYFERVIAWHESCRWWFRREKADYIFAPSANRIIAAVYGEPTGEGYAKIQKQARIRMLSHVVCKEPMNYAWVRAAVNRVSNPFSYDRNGSWDKLTWEEAISVACAIAKSYYEHKGEAIFLELDVKCNDRSYLFGRLLAIADRLENHARYLQTGKDDTDKRPTNAVRYMSAFVSKPSRTWKLIYGQLKPYIERLNGAEGYQKQIDEIMSMFTDMDKYSSDSEEALNAKYLMGYSLQRRALFNSKKEENHESNE